MALTALICTSAIAQERPSPQRPGISFQSVETQALQADESRNPGMLWVEHGGKLWNEPAGTSAKSCASCHGAAETSMKGVAARYPTVDSKPNLADHNAVDVILLEDKINLCRGRQLADELPDENQPLLSLTAFVSYQSRGMLRSLARSPYYPVEAEAAFERGRKLFHTRQGQLNLSCAQCHDDLVGKKLRGDTISQGQTHAWPAYRLEWQTMGSLQRRLRACSLGVRAEVLDYGHPDYLALEYYLAWRGEGLPMESPGVRR